MTNWLQLDPESIAERCRAAGLAVTPPSLAASIGRGVIGFTVVSVAGFAPWAVFGRWFHRLAGEAGMYVACAVVFIGLSGVLLHRLILGPGSLSRFYKLFGVAFAAYSVAWILGWMVLRGHLGGVAGLLAGTGLMAWVLAKAFVLRTGFLTIWMVLFALNAAGYFVGGWVEAAIAGLHPLTWSGQEVSKRTLMRTAMLMWGVCYGIGFGGALGFAFHHCQKQARQLLSTNPRG